MKKIISLMLCILTVAAFGGCGNDEPSAQKDVKADMFMLSQEMMKADETLPIMMIYTDKEDTDGSKLTNHCGLDRDKTNSYFFACEESENTHEISVIEMKSEGDVSLAQEALKQHAEALSKRFSSAPEKKARTDKYIITAKGRYTALIICDDPDSVKKVFEDSVK